MKNNIYRFIPESFCYTAELMQYCKSTTLWKKFKMEKNLKSLWKIVFFIICKKSRDAYLFICVNIYLKSLRVSFIFFLVQDTYCRYIKIFSSCLCLSQKQNDRTVSIMIISMLTVTLKPTKFQNHSQSIIEVVTNYRQNKQTKKTKLALFRGNKHEQYFY